MPCEKLHPLVCPRSLDLVCLERKCDVKLHTKKCKRPVRQPSDRGDAAKGKVKSAVSKPDREQEKDKAPAVSQPVWSNPGVVWPGPVANSAQWSQPGIVWPGQGVHAGQLHTGAGVLPGPVGGPPAPTGVPPVSGGAHPGWSGSGCYVQAAAPANQSGVWPGLNVGQPTGQAGAIGGQPGGSWPGQYVQPTAAPVWPGNNNHQIGNFNFQGNAAQGNQQYSSPGQFPSFQTRCTIPDPAVHQMLEAWAGNIQRELVKQTEILLSNKVKDMITHLGGQSGLRHSC